MWHLLGRRMVRKRTLVWFLCWLLQQTHYSSKLGFCRVAARSSNAVCYTAQASWRSWPLSRIFHSQHSPLTPSFFPLQGGPMLKGSRQIYTFIVKYNKSYQLVHLILWQQSIMFIWFRLVWNWAESISWKACLDWKTPEADPGKTLISNKMPWEISNTRKLWIGLDSGLCSKPVWVQ